MDADPSFFQSRNWRCINPPNGKYSSLIKSVYADSFYVRPVAIWLPDRLIPDFVPTCPHCKSNKHVDLRKARWQNSPKLLYGVNGYRYLDTKLYPCHLCKRQFTGYNPESMKHDDHQYIGFFNFHLSGRFAMDEELFSFICSNYDTPTPKIHRTLQQMAIDSYLNDCQLYLHAVRTKKVKKQRPNVCSHDPRQRTLHDATVDAPNRSSLHANERTLQSIRNEMQSVRLKYLQAIGKQNERVCFKTLQR